MARSGSALSRPAVENEVLGETDLLGVDAVQRQHAAGMENGGVQAVPDGMIEEHGVDDAARRRQQAVGDVAHTRAA